MTSPAGGLRVRSTAGRWVVAATVIGSSMAAIDGTVVGIALPYIGREYHVSLVQVQWVVSAYLLMLAALLVLGGALGDLLGRRRMFEIGVVWFAVASSACAAAPNATVLIVTRGVQGIGAALAVPQSLAIVQASFAPADRGAAIGAWAGFGGVATAAGPLVGGALVSAASWRWIFLINVPVAAVALLVSRRHLPESRQPGARGVDIPGAVLVVAALGATTYGLMEGPARGWSAPDVLAALAGGGAAAAAFVAAELRARQPLVPMWLFRDRQFVVTNVVTLIVYAALGGALFLLPVELEIVDRYRPIEAGAALLPLTLVVLVMSGPSGALAARIGPRLQMGAGPVVVGAGLALLARASSDAFYPTGVLPAVLVFGVGLGITVAPLTATALGSVGVEHSGLASAVNNDVSRAGGLVAVAVLPALAGISGTAYLHAVALAGPFRTAVWIAATWCAAGGVVAGLMIQNRREPPHVGARAEVRCAIDAAPLAVSPAGAGRTGGRASLTRRPR